MRIRFLDMVFGDKIKIPIGNPEIALQKQKLRHGMLESDQNWAFDFTCINIEE